MQTTTKLERFFRFLEIVRVVLVFYWQGFIVLRGSSEEVTRKRAVLFRKSLEQLSSVFVKFGQLLSLRPDFLPPIYCEELFYLLENVPPFPFEKTIQIFEEDFLTSPESLFRSIKKQPIASARYWEFFWCSDATLWLSEVKDMEGLKREHTKIVQDTLFLFEEGKKHGTPQVIGKKFFDAIRVLQKYNAKIPVNIIRYFRGVSTWESVILHIYPEMELLEMADIWRNYSLLNLLTDLPRLFLPHKINRSVMHLLNYLEKEIINYQN